MARNTDPGGRITQFKQQEVVQADPEFAIQTGWNTIDRQNWNTPTSGNASVNPTDGGLYELEVTSAEGDAAVLETVDRAEYVPGFAVLFGWAFIAGSRLSEDQEFRVGVTNNPAWNDAYQLRGIGTPAGEHTDWYLVIRKTNSDSQIRHWDQWAGDPRAVGWDETVGAICRNELGWYDFGEWKPLFNIPDLLDDDTNTIIDIQQNPDPDVRRISLDLEQISPVGKTATDNINFRWRAELENTGPNASANTMKVGNAQYYILGQNEPTPRFKTVTRNGGGIGGGNITTAQPYPLLAVRTDDSSPKATLNSVEATPITESHEISAYLMRKADVTFVNGADADMGPPPGLDTREAFFEDTDWNGISSVTRFDAAGTGNNDPHVGTEGYPYGMKIAGTTLQGSDQNKVAGQSNSLTANSQLTDLDYLVIFSRATETDGINLQALDYEMAVDR